LKYGITRGISWFEILTGKLLFMNPGQNASLFYPHQHQNLATELEIRIPRLGIASME
jgi:hypothetical protein